MPTEIIIVLSLLAFALVLFGSEKLPVDVVGIILVIGLVMSGVCLLYTSDAADE